MRAIGFSKGRQTGSTIPALGDLVAFLPVVAGADLSFQGVLRTLLLVREGTLVSWEGATTSLLLRRVQFFHLLRRGTSLGKRRFLPVVLDLLRRAGALTITDQASGVLGGSTGDEVSDPGATL